MTKIKAAVCHTFGQPLAIETINLRAPEMGEVEVTLKACAICHSDISFAEGGWGGTLPAVYGHEAAGHVTSVGNGVRGVSVGDAVVVTLIKSCGSCGSCSSGKPVICETGSTGDGPLTADDGTTLVQAMNCGAFAEKVVVDQSQIVRIPADMDMNAASLLACGVITGVGAVVNAAALRAGQDVVVIGAGGVGLNAIQGARIAGARRIIAVDMSDEKLAIAKDFGATDGVLASADAPWDAAKSAMGRGADAVFVTVGAVPVYNQAPNYLAPGGKVVMVGMPHIGDAATYDPGTMASIGQGMVGSKMGDAVIARDIPWMVDLYQQGRLKLDELVSQTWSLDQINDAIADTKTGSAKRNVIVFD
ncbi:MAG: alcohol dehydrogenase catalytic domain-containing protein [Yoonia sp.]|jgi:Zn-dependent alcohol dehydrogenase|nr:alcohol dehydrogenase catalytic domain-containing protein [Yoonia sp.]